MMILRLARNLSAGMCVNPFRVVGEEWFLEGDPRPRGDRVVVDVYCGTKTRSLVLFPDDLIEIEAQERKGLRSTDTAFLAIDRRAAAELNRMKTVAEITDRDHELYNKAVTNDWDGRQMLLAIAAAREEGRQEERARETQEQFLTVSKRDAARYRWLRKNSIAPLTWKVGIRFPGGANFHEPKTEAVVDSWIDEEMRRFP